MTQLPRAMLIDMDDTILSAYGRPDIAWNKIAAEFAAELAPLPPQQVAAAILTFARQFWATADAGWRLKLTEARQLSVKGGFAALGAVVTTSTVASNMPISPPVAPLSNAEQVGYVCSA